jgi:hypothetical protein
VILRIDICGAPSRYRWIFDDFFTVQLVGMALEPELTETGRELNKEMFWMPEPAPRIMFVDNQAPFHSRKVLSRQLMATSHLVIEMTFRNDTAENRAFREWQVHDSMNGSIVSFIGSYLDLPIDQYPNDDENPVVPFTMWENLPPFPATELPTRIAVASRKIDLPLPFSQSRIFLELARIISEVTEQEVRAWEERLRQPIEKDNPPHGVLPTDARDFSSAESLP